MKMADNLLLLRIKTNKNGKYKLVRIGIRLHEDRL